MSQRNLSHLSLWFCIFIVIGFSSVILAQTFQLTPDLSGPGPAPDSVFTMPQRQAAYNQLMMAGQQSVNARNWEAMERICRAGVENFPNDSIWRYNLACALALQGQIQEALRSLDQAVERGFRAVEVIEQDTHLDSLRQEDMFGLIVEKARALPEPVPAAAPPAAPGTLESGAVWVRASNTLWLPPQAVLVALWGSHFGKLSLPGEAPDSLFIREIERRTDGFHGTGNAGRQCFATCSTAGRRGRYAAVGRRLFRSGAHPAPLRHPRCDSPYHAFHTA